MSCGGAWTQVRDVAPGRDDLVLTICGPRVLEGTVTGLGPSPTINVDAIGFRHTTTAADGRFRVTGLPPEIATVTASGEGVVMERIDVRTVTRVELRGSERGRVIARVLDGAGDLRAGASCSWSLTGANFSSRPHRTDAGAVARFDVPAGQRVGINCSDGLDRVHGRGTTTVAAGATVEIEIPVR